MRYFLSFFTFLLLNGLHSIAQTTYAASWKLEYSLPFSPEKYTDVAFKLNEDLYPLGRFKGRYVPIDNKHPLFQFLPQNAFIALKNMTNDTAKVIYACKEEGQITLYENSPKKDIKQAKVLKNIVLQSPQTTETTQNTEITWQFEEFTQDNLLHTNLLIIINQKPYKVGIYEGKCSLLDSSEYKKYNLSDNIETAVEVKGIVIAAVLSEKECKIYEKQPNQELKLIKTFTL